jgi:hypothetical protein
LPPVVDITGLLIYFSTVKLLLGLCSAMRPDLQPNLLPKENPS